MEESLKQLLLKDLSARLTYGVIIELHLKNAPNDSIYHVTKKLESFHLGEFYQGITNIIIKPYLRPMSSMTKEEEREWWEYKQIAESWEGQDTRSIDWLNAHHFDYRGLIEKGLAIKVTKENNPYASN